MQMKKFRTGDRVQLIDELTQGVVLEVGPQSLRLKTDDGFEIQVAENEVVTLKSAGLRAPGRKGRPHLWLPICISKNSCQIPGG
jgi:hypothetical protein